MTITDRLLLDTTQTSKDHSPKYLQQIPLEMSAPPSKSSGKEKVSSALSLKHTLIIPDPYRDEPIGKLRYEGHAVLVWSLVCTSEGHVILLNGTGPDASLSACFMRLIKSKETAPVHFIPADTLSDRWTGPTELLRAESSYTFLRSALPEIKLKNFCLIAKSIHIAEGLKRPDLPPETFPLHKQRGNHFKTDARPRYLVANEGTEQPPTGSFYANLRAKQVVCLPDWEDILWQQGLVQGLIQPLFALGVSAWSLEPDLAKWTGLIKQGCLSGWWTLSL